MTLPADPASDAMAKLVNVGYGNVVVAARVVAIVTPSSAPMKRLKDEAREGGRLIDATQGRRTRSIIITDSDHLILSAIQPETVAARFLAPDLPDTSATEPAAEPAREPAADPSAELAVEPAPGPPAGPAGEEDESGAA